MLKEEQPYIDDFLNPKIILGSLAKTKITAFAKIINSDYKINWHHRLIAQKLEAFYRKEIKDLIITMPPRHGKTELCSKIFPAWVFGQDPNKQIIASSYSSDLSSDNNRAVQRIIEHPNYGIVFPKTRINSINVSSSSETEYRRNNEMFEIVDNKGKYKCSSIGSGIGGFGADILILDDPYKDEFTASSQATRDMVWSWYTSTALARLEKDGQVLIVTTRWHEDDIIGRIEREKNRSFEILKIEAIKESNEPYDTRAVGDALWPDKKSKQDLEKTKKDVGSKSWASVWQQNPRPREGTIVKEHQIKYYDKKPEDSFFIQQIQSWDLSFKGGINNDYVCGGVLGKSGDDIYLLDLFMDKVDFSRTISEFENMSFNNPRALKKYVEDAANGSALYSMLEKEISGIELWKPRGDKISRLSACEPYFSKGNIYFPKNHPLIDQCVTQLLGFPFTKNDDFVDMLTQGIINLTNEVKPAFRTVGSRTF